MFGRRKREQQAAEAAREAERLALFERLAERPEHICPFLGLADERTGYVEGVSDDHRCYAFGEPAPLSAEQQTRVCQERGYGNCPRYLRGVLVIPTEELEALRRPRAGGAPPVPPPPAVTRPGSGSGRERARDRGRGRGLLAVLAVLLLAVAAGGGLAYLVFTGQLAPVAEGSPTPSVSASVEPTPSASPEATPQPTPSVSPDPSEAVSPTPEPTPVPGDEFAFYEVAVAPGSYSLYREEAGQIREREIGFDGYSFAQAAPEENPQGRVWWVTQDGPLVGWAYLYPESGDFGIRAVFLNDADERRSYYLDDDELAVMPTGTPSPEDTP